MNNLDLKLKATLYKLLLCGDYGTFYCQVRKLQTAHKNTEKSEVLDAFDPEFGKKCALFNSILKQKLIKI